MKTYHARVERTISIELTFDESEIEDDDSPEVAAASLAQNVGIDGWYEEDEMIIISESIYSDA